MNKSFNQLAHYKQNQTYTLSHCKKKLKFIGIFPEDDQATMVGFCFCLIDALS